MCHSSWIKSIPEIVIYGHTINMTTTVIQRILFMLYPLMKKPSNRYEQPQACEGGQWFVVLVFTEAGVA